MQGIFLVVSSSLIWDNPEIQSGIETRAVTSILGPKELILSIPNPAPELSIPSPAPEISILNPAPELSVLNPAPELSIPNPAPELSILNPEPELSIPNPAPELSIHYIALLQIPRTILYL